MLWLLLLFLCRLWWLLGPLGGTLLVGGFCVEGEEVGRDGADCGGGRGGSWYSVKRGKFSVFSGMRICRNLSSGIVGDMAKRGKFAGEVRRCV